MPENGGGQIVCLKVANPAAEAEFFGKVYGSEPFELSASTLQVDTGSFLLRFERGGPGQDGEHVRFEINVDNVNKFTEEVWNRGVKYAARPRNHEDGLRRVGFASPSGIFIIGVGPPKMDSAGALPTVKLE